MRGPLAGVLAGLACCAAAGAAERAVTVNGCRYDLPIPESLRVVAARGDVVRFAGGDIELTVEWSDDTLADVHAHHESLTAYPGMATYILDGIPRRPVFMGWSDRGYAQFAAGVPAGCGGPGIVEATMTDWAPADAGEAMFRAIAGRLGEQAGD